MGVLTDERQHRYQTCSDEDCQRYACRIWRVGVREGYQRGAAAADKTASRQQVGKALRRGPVLDRYPVGVQFQLVGLRLARQQILRLLTWLRLVQARWITRAGVTGVHAFAASHPAAAGFLPARFER
jgi:hypothetical protein